MREAPAPARRRVVVAVAPNGGRKTKADHPALPLSAEEMARTAAECLERGAAMLHMHVRDSNGVHLLDAEAYRTAIAKVSQAVGDKLVVQITSEAIGRYGVEDQKAVILETNPEAASLALREFAPDEASEPAFAQFLGKLKVMRIWPQIILYAPEEVKRLAAMQAKGLIPFERLAVLFVLGRYSLLKAAAPVDLLPYLSPEWPRAPLWSVCAFGRREAACATAGALLGGHVRVGFENNLLLPSGERAESNAELVDVVASAIAWLGLATQSAEGLREEIAATMA